MQNIEICYIVLIWQVSYSIVQRSNIFFGVCADILLLYAEKMPFLGFVQKYYCPLRSRYQGVPGFPCRAIFGVCEEILVFRRNIHLWTLCYRPSIHPQGVCSGFLDSLDQLLKVEGVESMGDVVAALLSAQSHLWKNLAVFVHLAQQFDHVLCRIEGEVRLHHFQNPLKLALITCSSRL